MRSFTLIEAITDARTHAAMNDFIRIPKSKLVEIRTTLGETEGDDRETTIVCNLLTELAHQCEAKSNHRPVFNFDVSANEQLVGVMVSGVPALSYAGTRALIDMYPRDICNVRFLFAHEVTGERMTNGVVHLAFWRAAAPAEKRQRVQYQPLRANKRLRRGVELDYSNLHADADDCATLDALISCLVVMSRVMPELGWHVEPIRKHGSVASVIDYVATHTTLSSVAPKKRSRTGWLTQRKHHRSLSASSVAPPQAQDVLDEDDTVQSDHDTQLAHAATNNSSAHGVTDDDDVGFCLFCRGVPNFDSSFLDFLKKTFGNRILDMYVLAPALWTEQQPAPHAVVRSESTTSTSPSSIYTQGELAILIRRASCTEAESGEYALNGVDRLVRVIVRNAKAFGGVPCENNAKK